MPQPDILHNKPLPEIIDQGAVATASELTTRIESHDRVLDPTSTRRITWRQMIGPKDATIWGSWRGEQIDLFVVKGSRGGGTDSIDMIFPNTSDPAVARVLVDILVESTRKRVASDFPVR